MKTKISHLLKNHWSKLLSVFFFVLLLGAYVNIFAIDNPFSPGQTLNPNCGPETPNCTVDITQTESDPTVSTYVKGITESYFTNGNTAHSWGDHSTIGYVTGTPWTSMGYITGVNSSDVTTALGYTPYNSTNPSNYISDAPSDSLLYARRNGSWTTFTVPTTFSWSYTVKDDGWINLVDNGKIVHFNSNDDSLDVTTSFSPGHWYINSEVADDGHSHTSSSISGLSVSDFTSPNISNWTNDAGYITDGNTNWDNSYGFITGYTETDPIFTAWDKDYADLINTPTIPTLLSHLSEDITHRLVTDTEKSAWNGKQDALISGTNIKTINGSSVLGSGDLTVGGLISDADYNTKGGTSAGLNLVAGAQYNTFLGYEAGLSSATLSTNAADNNTAVGYRALYSNTTGFWNTANGSRALYSNTTGYQNTANGSYSLYFNTTGFNNTANGYNSLYFNTTGNYNTANGYNSLYNSGKTLTAGSFITGVLYTIQSSGDTDFTLCGASNSSVGTVFTATGPCTGTGEASSNSNNNIGIGYRAGMFIADGTNALNAPSNSIFLGADTKALIDGSDNEIVIGYNATGHGSNTATWGATSITNHYFSGNVQYSSYGAGTLTTDASGNITTSSDERLKDIIGYYDNNIDNTNNTDTENITEIQKGALERIIEINPIIYKWNEKSGLETEHSYIGFSAQNLQLAIPEAVGLDKRIDPETGENYLTISDRPILATVVNAIKEMDLKVKSFEDFETEENTLRDSLSIWLANATNKITRIFTGEICLTDGSEEEAVCLNASELRELKKNLIKEPNTIVDVKNEEEVSDICPNIDGVQTEIPEESELNEDGNCVLIVDDESVNSGIPDEAGVESGATEADEANTNTSTGSDNVENSESESYDQAGVDGSDSADDEEVVVDNTENIDNNNQNDGDVDGGSQTDEGDDNNSVISDEVTP